MYPSAIAVGDFNCDGLQDVVVGFAAFGKDEKFEIVILLNDGKGGYYDGTKQIISGTIPSMWSPRRIVVADLNGDGRNDIFIAGHGLEGVPALQGEPNKLLLSTAEDKLVDASSNLPQIWDFSHCAAAADIDGDGHIDLIVGNLGCVNYNGAYLLMNDGTGKFTLNTDRLPQQDRSGSA